MAEAESATASSALSGNPPSVFLSYSRRDFYFAEQVRASLQQHGVRVWMDLAELGPGDDWSQRTDQAISQADAVVLLATRASARSRYVIRECALAVKQSVPVYVALGQGCAIPAFLRTANRYDARSRFADAMAVLARDLEGSSGHASRVFAGRLPRAELPVTFALTVMILTLLVCAAIVLGYLLSLFTPFANATLVQTSSLRLTTERSYVILEMVSFLASAGIGAACAWALARRRWQLNFAAWLSVALLQLFTQGTRALPLTSSYIRLDGGAGSQALSSAFLVLARASVVLSLLAVPMLVVLVGSVAVLRSSRTGAGSSVARLRLHAQIGRAHV